MHSDHDPPDRRERRREALRPDLHRQLPQGVKLAGVDGETKDYPVHPQVLDSDALARAHTKNGTYLMPMAFPEGSPTHPAHGAGHATVAWACVTVLKAFFADREPLPSTLVAKVPNADGSKVDLD